MKRFYVVFSLVIVSLIMGGCVKLPVEQDKVIIQWCFDNPDKCIWDVEENDKRVMSPAERQALYDNICEQEPEKCWQWGVPETETKCEDLEKWCFEYPEHCSLFCCENPEICFDREVDSRDPFGLGSPDGPVDDGENGDPNGDDDSGGENGEPDDGNGEPDDGDDGDDGGCHCGGHGKNKGDRPGWGKGDKNHHHTGPPGLNGNNKGRKKGHYK